MLVQQILKDKPQEGVFTIQPGTKVSEAAAILSEKRIGALIVSTDGVTPAGILSERDIVRELGRRGSVCLEDEVDALMTTKLVSCTPADRAIQVLQTMTEGRFRHMPVLDEDGKMVGFVSIGDVVKARLSELSMQADSLKQMIMGY